MGVLCPVIIPYPLPLSRECLRLTVVGDEGQADDEHQVGSSLGTCLATPKSVDLCPSGHVGRSCVELIPESKHSRWSIKHEDRGLSRSSDGVAVAFTEAHVDGT
jgi:hypothetical protein